MERHLDGIYFRVKRNDEWCNICLSDLTSEEREEILKGKEKPFLRGCINHLCDVIKEIGEAFDIERGEE